METIRLSGQVKKIVNIDSDAQAQISFEGAGVLYDELRVPNKYNWSPGEVVVVVIKKQDGEKGAANGNSNGNGVGTKSGYVQGS